MVSEQEVEDGVDAIRKRFTTLYDIKINHPYAFTPPNLDKVVEKGYSPDDPEKEKIKKINSELAKFLEDAERGLKSYAPSLSSKDLKNALKDLEKAAMEYNNKNIEKAQEYLSKMYKIAIK